MINKIFFLVFVLLTTQSFTATEFDKDIVVKNQTRNDKVKTVFKEMMNAYEEEDSTTFFSYVSEDRFHQDYMTFLEAIEEDIRLYDILSVDTWVNNITDDGVKRYLYVQWEKRYDSSQSDTQITQKGYTRFLFDEINGKYKLIELSGNNFWGGSLPEWTEEVADIAGQEAKTVALPDLIITTAVWFNLGSGTTGTTVNVKNQGSADITDIVKVKNTNTTRSNEHTTGISVGETVTIEIDEQSGGAAGNIIEVDPHNIIEESDETNNEKASQ